MNDLAEDPERQQIISELFAKLEEMGKDLGDTLSIRSYFPEFQ